MRRKAKRDLLTLIGVVAVLAGIVLVNGYSRRDALRERYEQMRAAFEEKHRGDGVEVVDWEELRKVTGKRVTGAGFPESLKKKDGRLVNICGFMSPIDQFKNVTEFMLLPVPMTCYFCEAPPMRDIIQVKLSKPASMVNEPVLIGGRLRLHEGPKQMFFYTIEEARWNEAVKDDEYMRTAHFAAGDGSRDCGAGAHRSSHRGLRGRKAIRCPAPLPARSTGSIEGRAVPPGSP